MDRLGPMERLGPRDQMEILVHLAQPVPQELRDSLGRLELLDFRD